MIKENLQKLSQEADIWIRIPMVHNVNDTEQELDEIIKYISSLGDGVKKDSTIKISFFRQNEIPVDWKRVCEI